MQMSWRPLSKKPGRPYHLSSATNWSPPCHAELRQYLKQKEPLPSIEYIYSKLTYFQKANNSLKMFFIGLMKYLICWDWWVLLNVSLIITIKRTKDLNYFSLCALNLFNTRVSQFELNYWNKWTFPHILIYWDAPVNMVCLPTMTSCCFVSGNTLCLLSSVHDLSTNFFSCKWVLLYFWLPVLWDLRWYLILIFTSFTSY